MYHFEIQEGIETQVSSEAVRHLYRLWQRYTAAGGGLPALADLGPKRLDWCAADLMLVEPVDGDDFFYRHYGSAIAQASGFDMTGKRTSEFRSDVGSFFREKYAQCLSTGRPMYTVHRASHVPTVHTWERLLLPVRDGAVPLVLVLNRPMAFRHEFLTSVLESSTNGIVHAVALPREREGRHDFYVLSANAAAGRVLGSRHETLQERRLSEVLPGQMAKRTMDLCDAVYRSGEAASVEVHGLHNGVHRHVLINGVRAGDGVTLMLADVTAFRAQAQELRALEVRLAREQEARRRLEAELRNVADKDSLTGVQGRNAFMRALAIEIDAALRHRQALSLLVVDLDGFKELTDVHGTVAGEHQLVATARLCQHLLRQCDLLGCVGGSVFAAALVETDAAAARTLGLRLGEAVAARFKDETMLSHRATASMGVAQLRAGDSAEAFIARSEDALREAREAGRAQLRVAAP